MVIISFSELFTFEKIPFLKKNRRKIYIIHFGYSDWLWVCRKKNEKQTLSRDQDLIGMHAILVSFLLSTRYIHIYAAYCETVNRFGDLQ